ncbi:gcy-3, partial [Pristionchus pacificus]|uniref:Guanylate cyclase n=1 Tax=Pristionchus pacificus TaxID=54126 RepID=A0A2A6CWZ5_PRIPA
IRIGLLVAENVDPTAIAYSTSGGAISVALDRIKNETLLSGYNFTFFVRNCDCDPVLTMGAFAEFALKLDVHAVVGPPCGGLFSGTMSTAYSIPTFMWGYTFLAELANDTRFPYVSTITATSLSLGYGFMKLAEYNQWDKIAILYTRDSTKYCDNIITDTLTAINDPNTYQNTLVYTFHMVKADQFQAVLDESDDTNYTARMQGAKDRARIIVLCLSSGPSKRKFFAKANLMGMTTNEFVYVMLSVKGIGFGQSGNAPERLASGYIPFWVDTVNNNTDGLTALAKQGATRIINIDLARRSDSAAKSFNVDVIKRITGAPLYCNSTACLNAVSNNQSVDVRFLFLIQAATFARSLYDAFYLYALALNRTLAIDPVGGLTNANLINRNLAGTFYGMTGDVTITANGTRAPFFTVSALDTTQTVAYYFNITVDANQMQQGQGCNDCADFWDQNGVYIGIGAALASLVVLAAVAVAVYVYRERKKEIARLNSLWQISHRSLEKHERKKLDQSLRSLTSSTVTVTTKGSKGTLSSDLQETSTTAFYYFNKDLVMASKHETFVKFDNTETIEFRKMRTFDHDNVNRFIGMSLDGPQILSIWKYCSRGSLKQIVELGTMQLDSYFVFSLIRDIVQGLDYLHSSFLQCHGNLTSSSCLVDDRWQVKLSDYGLRSVRDRTKKRGLWQAPELLRDASAPPTKPSDVYAFSIVASEVITRQPAWKGRKESMDELLYMVKRGGPGAPRPLLEVPEGIELNMTLLHLVRDCWSEEPAERPTIEQVKSIMRSMVNDRQQNLMDHVFAMMEQYAGTLEEEVIERTRELVEEKKKSDLLLYRMLPRQVADKLKLGQSVEPESFECVTIFFSDVVKFTLLSQKCTAIQIINLLNELYTSFDTIIENHSVYKVVFVETIGDGYLCVSGLPNRNGTEHVRNIAEMALDFMAAAREYRVTHLPAERVTLRIGINTGPCVAGVVGLTMPRYCLFGDTVNTGSRMESNGKPGLIHMSSEANNLLVSAYAGQYTTQSRGDVIIKGKGVMETFWLMGRANELTVMLNPPAIPPPTELVPAPAVTASVRLDTVNDSGDVGLYTEYLRA